MAESVCDWFTTDLDRKAMANVEVDSIVVAFARMTFLELACVGVVQLH